jgi:hypothetical protein
MPDDSDNLSAPPPDERLVRALTQLQPAAARLDRDRIMFAAGAESRRSTARLWQLAAGFLTAVGFAAGWIYQNSQSTYAPDRDPPARHAPSIQPTK